jgi:hypothetical protein
MPNVREYRGHRGPAARARGGLTRGRASRQMSQLDSNATRSLVSNQHKSLAMLAGQSMRRLKITSPMNNPPGRFKKSNVSFSITEEEVFENDCPLDTSDDALLSVNSKKKLPPPPINGDESATLTDLDEFSLDALCKHVSYLMSEDSDEEEEEPAVGPNTDATSSGAPEINNFDFDIDQVDLETQAAEMRLLEEAHQERMSVALSQQNEDGALVGLIDEDEVAASSTPTNSEMIEVSPGEFLPFCGSKKTFDALLTGDYCVTKCFACTEDLVTSSVDLVICSDCWVFSPVTREQRTDGDASSDSDESYSPPSSVGLGVKSEELKQWLE